MRTQAARLLPASIRRVLRFAMIAGLAGSAGCSPANQGPGNFGDIPETHLQQDLRIDGYRQELVPIIWAGVSPNGTIALIQTQDGGVRLFDCEGRSLGLIGRKGQGPGEFVSPLAGGWTGDSLWIHDVALRRVTVISPDLSIARMVTIQPALGQRFRDGSPLPEFMVVYPRVLLQGDTMLSWGLTRISDPVAQAIHGKPLFRFTPDGKIDRVVVILDLFEGWIPVTLAGGYSSNAQIPFHIGPLSAWAPDGSRVVKLNTVLDDESGGTVHVRLYAGNDGSPILDASYPFRGIPVPPAVLDSVVSDWVARATAPEVRKSHRGGGQGSRRHPSIHPWLECSSRRTASGSASEEPKPGTRGSCSMIPALFCSGLSSRSTSLSRPQT